MTAACPANPAAGFNGAIQSLPFNMGKRMRAPRSAGGASRPPTCRIAPDVGGWVLELDPTLNATHRSEKRMSFHSLMAAIDYAVRRGWRYRVVHVTTISPSPGGCTNRAHRAGQ